MKEKFYKKTWFIVLMLLFIPPVGLVLMWISKKSWNKVIKIILTVILGLWTLLLTAVMATPTDAETIPETEVTTSEKAQFNETSSYKEENTKKDENITEPVGTTKKEVESETEKITSEKTDESTEKNTESTKKPTTTKKETTTKKPTTTQKETTTKKPTTTQKPTTTRKPTTTKTPTTVNPDARVTVYITKTGKKYHYENPCGNGSYTATTLEKAKQSGLTACEKCVLH